jgi:hypothetical protein
MTMMPLVRSSISIFLLAVLAAGGFSCSNDEHTLQKYSETPLATFRANNRLMIAETGDGNLYSLGYQFSVKRNGAVTAFGIESPLEGAFEVELYEVTGNGGTGVLIASETVTIHASYVYKYKFATLATPLPLEVGKKYRVAYSTHTNKSTFLLLEDQVGFNLPISDNSE